MHLRSIARAIMENVADVGRKVVGRSAKGWTPLGTTLIRELLPGEIHYSYIYSPSP